MSRVIKWVLGTWLTGMVFIAMLSIAFAAPPTAVYNWGTYYGDVNTDKSMALGDQFILNTGWSSWRTAITAGDAASLGLAACTDLSCMETAIIHGHNIYRDPRLKVLMLTLSDFSSEWDGMKSANILAHKNNIITEYTNFLTQLKADVPAGVTVYLSNWEGDNMVYCGQAWTAASVPGWLNANCSNWSDRMVGFYLWKSYVRQAIQTFNANNGTNYVPVVEFNAINMFNTQAANLTGQPRVMDYVAMQGWTGSIICSYSSYESIYTNTLSTDLEETGGFGVKGPIAAGCNQIILGEAGFRNYGVPTYQPGVSLANLYSEVDAAVTRVNNTYTGMIPLVVLWDIFDAPDTSSASLCFGMFYTDNNGNVPSQTYPLSDTHCTGSTGYSALPVNLKK